MRRLLMVLLLAACVTESVEPAGPAVWYSQAPLPEPPRVGTVDRDRVVQAFRESRVFREYCAAMTRQRERAERAGDERQAAVLRLQERSLLDIRDGKVGPSRGMPSILLVLDRVLPQVAVQHGVNIIVDAGSWKGEAQNMVDVTDALLAELPGEG